MLALAALSDNLTVGEVASAWSGWIWLIGAIYLVLALIAAVLVARKAGYSHWLGVIAVLVPAVGAIVVLLFAFVKWPALRERDAAKALLKEHGLSLDEPPSPGKAAAAPKDAAKPEA